MKEKFAPMQEENRETLSQLEAAIEEKKLLLQEIDFWKKRTSDAIERGQKASAEEREQLK